MSGNTALLRVAMVGVHRSLARTPAHHNWATAFDAVPETSIAAVFDLGAETRAEFLACWGSAIPAYDDYQRMLAEVQPDLVCIATHQRMHADQIEQAIEAGVRGILCDKPLATSLDEMDRIVAAGKGQGVPLAFGLDRRWTPAYRYLRQVLAEGAIGTVTSVLAYGLPNLINHGCHWYDVMLALAGDPEPTWVSGEAADVSGEPADSRARMDPTGNGRVGLSNGVHGYVSEHGAAGGLSFEVLGENGRLLILDDARTVYLLNVETGAQLDAKPTHQPQPLDLPAPSDGWTTGPAAVQDLVQAVNTGSNTACDLDEARRATEIGFALHASSVAAGARVEVPVADRSMRIESYPWGNE